MEDIEREIYDTEIELRKKLREADSTFYRWFSASMFLLGLLVGFFISAKIFINQ